MGEAGPTLRKTGRCASSLCLPTPKGRNFTLSQEEDKWDVRLRSTYLDGTQVAQDSSVGGVFSNWAPSSKLGLANEFTLNRSCLGEFHLVAIYERDLLISGVLQNFNAGQKGP